MKVQQIFQVNDRHPLISLVSAISFVGWHNNETGCQLSFLPVQYFYFFLFHVGLCHYTQKTTFSEFNKSKINYFPCGNHHLKSPLLMNFINMVQYLKFHPRSHFRWLKTPNNQCLLFFTVTLSMSGSVMWEWARKGKSIRLMSTVVLQDHLRAKV